MVLEIPALLTLILSLAILMMATYRSLRTLVAALLSLLDGAGVSRIIRPHLPLGIIIRWRELQTRCLLHPNASNGGLDRFTREGQR